MNNWLPKKKMLIVVAASVVMGVIMYLAGLYVVNAKISEIEAAYKENESVAAEEERAKAINEIAQEYAVAIETLRNFFVETGDEVRFIERIEGVAKNLDLSPNIKSITQGRVEEGSIKEDILISIELTGPWQSVINFINDIEKLPFGVLVTEVDMKAETLGNWTSTVELIVFRQR